MIPASMSSFFPAVSHLVWIFQTQIFNVNLVPVTVLSVQSIYYVMTISFLATLIESHPSHTYIHTRTHAHTFHRFSSFLNLASVNKDKSQKNITAWKNALNRYMLQHIQKYFGRIVKLQILRQIVCWRHLKFK